MSNTSFPIAFRLGLLEEVIYREAMTPRQSKFLRILWQESFLSGAGLNARTEANLGRDCFGAAAARTFRRDIRALKALLKRAGFSLRFSRRAARSGYYIVGRPDLAPELAKMTQAGIQDADPR